MGMDPSMVCVRGGVIAVVQMEPTKCNIIDIIVLVFSSSRSKANEGQLKDQLKSLKETVKSRRVRCNPLAKCCFQEVLFFYALVGLLAFLLQVLV